MKKEIEVCDVCEKEAGLYECEKCKKKLCYKCIRRFMVESHCILKIRDDGSIMVGNGAGIDRMSDVIFVCRDCFAALQMKMKEDRGYNFLNMLHENIIEKSFDDIRKFLIGEKK